MKKCLVHFYSYILLFLIVAGLSVGFLVGTTYVPQNLIQKQMEESADIFCKNIRIWYMVPGVRSSVNHLYADVITENIAYHLSNEISEDSPLQTVMWDKYYAASEEVNEALRSSVAKRLPANTQYLRYWHGSAGVVRLLHIFMNINQIYLFHALVICVLTAILFWILFRNHLLPEAIVFVASMIMVSVWFVPFCLEYYWCFLVMLITGIVDVKLALKEKWKYASMLFLMAGMITVFLDFLSTETVTLLIPLLLVIRIYLRKQRDNSAASRTADAWKLSIKSCVMWLIGYLGMWAFKWVLASFILHQNVMPYVTEHISERISGGQEQLSQFEYIIEAITRNVIYLLPFDYGIIGKVATLALILVLVVLVIKDKIRIRAQFNKNVIALYALLGCVPIVRFAVLHNHAWIHRFFTFRALSASIMALCFIGLEIMELVHIENH